MEEDEKDENGKVGVRVKRTSAGRKQARRNNKRRSRIIGICDTHQYGKDLRND